MTGKEESGVLGGSCEEEATRASASRKISRMSSAAPALGAPSGLEDASGEGWACFGLRSHQTTANTARARRMKTHIRKTHRLAPCKFSHSAPNHAIMAAKTKPITPTKCCQESCITFLPSQQRGERVHARSAATDQCFKKNENQQGEESAGNGTDRQTANPRIRFDHLHCAFRNGPSGREPRQGPANSADFFSDAIEHRAQRILLAEPVLPLVAEKNAERIDFEQIGGAVGIAAAEEPVDILEEDFPGAVVSKHFLLKRHARPIREGRIGLACRFRRKCLDTTAPGKSSSRISTGSSAAAIPTAPPICSKSIRSAFFSATRGSTGSASRIRCALCSMASLKKSAEFAGPCRGSLPLGPFRKAQ